MTRIAKFFFTLTLSLAIVVPQFVSVNAMETSNFQPQPELSEASEIRNDLLSIGVAEDKVETLVNKLQNGELLDSMKAEYADMEPTNVVRIGDDYIEETYVYPDGSIKQTRISGGTFTGTITGGNHQIGSNYYSWMGAKVFATWGVVTASFYADFEGTPDSGRISRVYDWGIITAGGTFSEHELKINNSTATASTPANAHLFFIGTVLSDFGQATFYLRLYVPKGSAPYARLSVLN